MKEADRILLDCLVRNRLFLERKPGDTWYALTDARGRQQYPEPFGSGPMVGLDESIANLIAAGLLASIGVYSYMPTGPGVILIRGVKGD